MLPLVVAVVGLLFGTPLMEIIIYVLILNTLQSAWDIIVPWMIVYPTKIYEKYCIW